MTKSAKPDTGQPRAQSATTEPAGIPDDARPEPGPAPAAGAGDGTNAAEAAQPDLDETKRRFREALERKHQAHNDAQGQGNRDGGKINGSHGPAASRRNFRRKSG